MPIYHQRKEEKFFTAILAASERLQDIYDDSEENNFMPPDKPVDYSDQEYQAAIQESTLHKTAGRFPGNDDRRAQTLAANVATWKDHEDPGWRQERECNNCKQQVQTADDGSIVLKGGRHNGEHHFSCFCLETSTCWQFLLDRLHGGPGHLKTIWGKCTQARAADN